MEDLLYWETIEHDTGSRLTTERAEVPGGWLVRTYDNGRDGYPYHPSICFVPDPEHTWGSGGSTDGR